MAVERWTRVERRLPRNVIKRRDMEGHRTIVESGGWGGAMREKGTPKDLGILDKRGAKGFALKRSKGMLLMMKKTQIRNTQMGKSRRLILKGNTNKAMESFALSIKPFIPRKGISMVSYERERGTVGNRKESRIPYDRGKFFIIVLEEII